MLQNRPVTTRAPIMALVKSYLCSNWQQLGRQQQGRSLNVQFRHEHVNRRGWRGQPLRTDRHAAALAALQCSPAPVHCVPKPEPHRQEGRQRVFLWTVLELSTDDDCASPALATAGTHRAAVARARRQHGPAGVAPHGRGGASAAASDKGRHDGAAAVDEAGLLCALNWECISPAHPSIFNFPHLGR